jgi:multidrug efflux system membrane fusion protein
VRKFVTRLLALLIALSAVGAVYIASTKQVQQKAAGSGKRGGGGGGGAGGDAPTPVIGAEAKLADVPVFLEGVGTAKALNTVTVRAQVDGKLMKLHFKEGQNIKKGDLLAEIDPTPYQAAYDQAAAKKAVTETQLANARKDSERYGRIPGVIAQKTVDTQTALVAQLEAQSRADSAAVASAKTVLDYTRVLSPLSGRTGLRQVDEGNIIRAGADTGLVTITQVQPISVMFTLPQQQLQVINRAMAKGPVAAEAMDADAKTVLDRGTLQVVDNQVDQTTGTVRMKADFPNATLQLWPGQFVNVRLLIETLREVVTVPTPAIQRGPNGVFVYLVGAEDRVSVRSVVLGQQSDVQTIVTSGLAVNDKVVTSGFARLQDGARVVFGKQGGETPPAKNGPTAGKGGESAEGGGRFRQICAADLQTHCAGIARDQMRQCIETNVGKFTDACKVAVAERNAGPGQGEDGKGKGGGRRRDGAATAAESKPLVTGTMKGADIKADAPTSTQQ